MADTRFPIDDPRGEARDHIHLATIAQAVSVAEMHIDLALFSEARARAIDATNGGATGEAPSPPAGPDCAAMPPADVPGAGIDAARIFATAHALAARTR